MIVSDAGPVALSNDASINIRSVCLFSLYGRCADPIQFLRRSSSGVGGDRATKNDDDTFLPWVIYCVCPAGGSCPRVPRSFHASTVRLRSRPLTHSVPLWLSPGVLYSGTSSVTAGSPRGRVIRHSVPGFLLVRRPSCHCGGRDDDLRRVNERQEHDAVCQQPRFSDIYSQLTSSHIE